MSQKITARFILEVAGKPVSNVEKALEVVEKKIKDEKRFKVLESEIIEPELDEKTKLYSGLIEVQARFENIQGILEFVLDYTPSSVEVEDPEKIQLDIASLNAVLNDFSGHILKTAHHIRILSANIHMRDKQIEELGGVPPGKEKKK